MKYKGLKINSVLDFGGEDTYKRNLNILRLIFYNICNPFITISISLVKLSMFSVINMMHPIIQAFVTKFLFGEKIKKVYYVTLVTCFIGIVIMCSKPDYINEGENVNTNGEISDEKIESDDSTNAIKFFLGILASLISAIAAGFFFPIQNKILKTTDVYNTNLFVAFWSIPISFMISFIFEYEYLSYYFNFFMLWTSFGNGFFMAISFLLMTRSLEKVSCNKTSYMAYIQLPLITLFGLVFFNERVTFVEFIGGLVIVSSIVITTQFS
jgi:drug/metabolite transporter (DMT)-like permease